MRADPNCSPSDLSCRPMEYALCEKKTFLLLLLIPPNRRPERGSSPNISPADLRYPPGYTRDPNNQEAPELSLGHMSIIQLP